MALKEKVRKYMHAEGKEKYLHGHVEIELEHVDEELVHVKIHKAKAATASKKKGDL